MYESNGHQYPELTVLESDHPGQKRRPSIPENTISQMKSTLSRISPSDWASGAWDVTVPTSGKQAKIRFPNVGEHEAALLRTMALSYLLQYASPNSTQQVVREAALFLQFLDEKGIHIEDTRSSIVRLYIDHLEHLSIGTAQQNSRIRAAATLFETCVECDLVTSGVKTVDFSYRFPEAPSRRRAPDQCVTDALDILVLNIENDEIPLVMRLVYFTVRLIPNRISEVLGMNKDCLGYPDLGLFSVQIPTSKETPLHIPIYYKYNFSMAGELEQTFYRLIRMQQEVLTEHDDSDVVDSDYLFYDYTRGRVVSDSDFNQFIAGLISKHKIRNSDGGYPVVTSHMFRHVTIVERNRSDAYSLEDTMKEAGHTNPAMTLSYGYMSERDEAKYLGEITAKVMKSELGLSDELSPTNVRAVSSVKYARIQSAPFTRVIPGMGLCSNASCNPQYADCIKCASFNADPAYLEYFQATHEIIEKRLEKIRAPGAIEFEREQLEIVDAYIDRLTDIPTENQEERRDLYATG